MSETPEKHRMSLETGTFDIISSKETDLPTKPNQLRKDARSLDKKTTASKENRLFNDIRESIETSLNHKMKILLKDLKKKRIEYTMRQQEYNEELDRMHKKQEQESIKVLNYELLNNPRYEFDREEVQNIKQRFSVLQNEFSKTIGIINDDNVKSIITIIKTNYDNQLKDIIDNAERSLKSISKIKNSFEQPINDMITKLKLQEFELETNALKFKTGKFSFKSKWRIHEVSFV